jgi:hypothetical protein
LAFAVAYVRTSTSLGERELGLDTQRALITKFAGDNGSTVTRIFRERRTGVGKISVVRSELSQAIWEAR